MLVPQATELFPDAGTFCIEVELKVPLVEVADCPEAEQVIIKCHCTTVPAGEGAVAAAGPCPRAGGHAPAQASDRPLCPLLLERAQSALL